MRRLVEDETNRLVVKALVDIATGMGKKTIAEQIEDGPTLNLLREYGVDFAQGYFLGRPQTAKDITALLQRLVLASAADELAA